MTKSVKGFFFDLDGTLVNTHESNFRAYQQAIKDICGVHVESGLKEKIMSGESSADFLSSLLPQVTKEEIISINNRKREIYSSHLNISKLNNYLSNFLKQMAEHYKVALVTTAKEANARAVLDAHGLSGYFSCMIFGDDVARMKPHPEAYQRALEITGLSADEVIAFEDSQKGLDAAHGAGITTIHIRDFL